MQKLSVLIIDDNKPQLRTLKLFVSNSLGHKTFTASEGREGLKIIEKHTIDLVLTDFLMPMWDGLTVLKKIKKYNPQIDVVIMTAYGNLEKAVEAMKAGAYDYITKPFKWDELKTIINHIAEKRALIAENQLLKQQFKEKYKFETIQTQSKEMEKVISTAARSANSKATILITGESGTGKELIAKAIHAASPRMDKPFVVINIAALSENLLESELFGHEKGAFTGASTQRIGFFEQADGGTLFIDEIGDIPLPVQVKLLRAIQFCQITRIGGNTILDVDVRIIAATHRNLEEMIKIRAFRKDLFYRLNVVTINLPPLRQRKTDITILTDQFIKKYSTENQKPIKGISREAIDGLMKHPFPGNIRELENLIERAVVLCRDEYLTQDDLPPLLEQTTTETIFDPLHLEEGFDKKAKTFEKVMIGEALKRCNGNRCAAARLLAMTERRLRFRMKNLEIEV